MAKKGKLVFSFKPTVKFILSTNSLPSTKDKSNEGYREDNKAIYNSFRHWAYKNGHKGWASISSQRFWNEFDGIAVSK